jgi:hypothetical protein
MAKSTSHSTLSTTVGELEVKASLDGNGSITSSGGAVTVSFAGGRLTIDKTSVRLDDQEIAKLPAGAKKVDVDYSAGKLTVAADGVDVVAKTLAE